MTKLGWPVAQPRLTSRPCARTMRRLPSGKIDLVDLRLHLFPLVVAQARDRDLAVEMADVADDGAVLHVAHVVERDDVDIAGGGDEDVADGARPRPW